MLNVVCEASSDRCSEQFDIDSATGRITASRLSLDYPSTPSCVLKLIATDAGLPRRQTARYITVEQPATTLCRDVDTFNISFTIEENTTPGSVVGYMSSSEYFLNRPKSVDDVSAINSDDEEKTFWLVAGNAMGTFSVDSVSGALVIVGTVDYETCPRYQLVVSVFDSVGQCIGELSVEVSVVNVNDNPPQFDVDLTYITVRQATPSGAEVYSPVVHDADNSTLIYAMAAAQSSEGVASWLAVDSVTGTVVTRQPLEQAPDRMHVVITATDVIGHVTSMTLVVTVVKDACVRRRDVVTKRVTVVEDAVIGSVITLADSGDESSCSRDSSVMTYTYRLVSSNDFDMFIIDRLTGQYHLTPHNTQQ